LALLFDVRLKVIKVIVCSNRMEMRHFTVARFLQRPGGDASEHVHRVNASSAMGERCLMGIQFQGSKEGYMPTRAPAKKKANKSASKRSSKTSKTSSKKSAPRGSQKKSAPKRVTARKSGKRSAKGILTKAKEALKTVIAGAASGAAEGAVVGAAEAGSKVTGVGTTTNEEATDQSKAQGAGKK
jgi:hypothetical protein